MTQATLVDGLGQLHTRVYAAVGDLPAPFLGAMAIVDGGTGGDLYVSLHDISGSLAWIAFTVLYDAVVVNPTSTDNHIVQSTSGAFGLSIDSEGPGAAFQARNGYEALDVAQLDGATAPLVSGSRNTVVGGQPLLRLRPDTSTDTIQVNGFGEISAIAYDALPTMTSDHLGAIIRVLATGEQDKFYMGVLDASSTPIWTQFIGPTGATGATGATGPAPVIGTPTVTGLPAGDAPTISQTGSGTSGDPYIDHFGIPAGATGPAGSISFPDLPIDGASVTFAMNVLSGGSYLPWRLPAGYTFQVLSTTGLWGYEDAGTGDIWVYPGVGSGSVDCDVYGCGRLLSEEHHTQGAGDTDLGDPLTAAITVLSDADILLFENIQSGTVPVGEIIAVVEIVSIAAGAWFSHVDFTASDGGFAAVIETGSPFGTYSSGTGWEAAGVISGGYPYKGVYILLTIDSTALTSIEMFGTATFSNLNPANAMIGAGGSGFLAYDTGATAPPSGPIDWLWNGVVSHPSNPSSPQAGQTQLILFIFSSDHDETSGASLITGCTIHGTGAKPPQLP